MDNLRIPGPTPCPPEVLQAMARPMINHRGPEFAKILLNVTDKLKQCFMTKTDLYVLTSSGTGGMEAAVVNTLSPGDKVLSISIGFFGDRFGDIARLYGADVISLKFEPGKAADPDAIRKALKADPKIKAVLVTHNETSTGVTNDLQSISKVVREFEKLFLVDAISSMGSVPLPVDEWGGDVTVTASQKGWMVPPGLAMVNVSPKAWQAYETAKMPRNYWDFGKARKYLEKGQTPWTPAVSIFFALEVALGMMLKEGMANIYARHARVGKAARDSAKSLGLSIFADEKYASNTVTAVATPPSLDTKALLKIMREGQHVVLAGGQGAQEGKIFRIGHLGLVNEKDIKVVIDALKIALPKAGFTGK